MLPLLLTALIACTNPPVVQGTVADIWGNPVEGATVMMEGVGERPLTDANGVFTMNLVPGKHTIKAGKEGYIQEHQEIELQAGVEKTKLEPFRLFPKPPENGFFIITTGDYTQLQPEPVSTLGHELSAHYGLKSHGKATAEGSTLKVLFHTELKIDEIHRLGLELHKLKYVKSGEMPGPLSTKTEVELNLWQSDTVVPIEITPMRSRSDYLITTKEAIEPGTYALQSGAILNPKSAEEFAKIPEELRVVFPVDVR